MIINNLSKYTWIISSSAPEAELKNWIVSDHADDAFDLYSDEPVWEVFPLNDGITAIACAEQSTFALCQQFAAELSLKYPEIPVEGFWPGRLTDEPVNLIVFRNGKLWQASNVDAENHLQQLSGKPDAAQTDPGREYLVLPGTTWEECLAVLRKLEIPSGRFQHWHNHRNELVVFDPLNASALGAFKFSRNLPDRQVISITGNSETGRYFYSYVLNKQELEREEITPVAAAADALLHKKFGIKTTGDLLTYFGIPQ